MKKSSLPVAMTRRQHPFVEWMNAMWFLYGWAAREHYLNLQAMRPAPAETPPGATRIPSPRLRELANRVALMLLRSAKAAPEKGLLPATRQRDGRGDANANELPG